VTMKRLALYLSFYLAACATPGPGAAPSTPPTPASAAAAAPVPAAPAPAPVAAAPAPLAPIPTLPSPNGKPAVTESPAPARPPVKPAAISKAPFGQVDGQDVDLYTLTNAGGLVLKVTTYGAIVTNLEVPDRTGQRADVVLGFDDLAGYLKNGPYFGATVGRVGNRIRNARFVLGGKTYKLAANDKPHALHGGIKGWNKVVWKATPLDSPAGPALRLEYLSRDGEEGYPGNVTASVTYALTNDNELRVSMRATTDKVTIVNMVHHTYWNLGGEGAGSITEHELVLHADHYTPGDPLVPTGAVKAVKGTPFDFTVAKAVGRELGAVGGNPVGYDNNFVVNGAPTALRPVARLKDPKSGRVMTLDADQPGVQFYTGNFLDESLKGKGGHAYAQHAGLCLETQKFPNAINVPAWKNQVILRPGQTYVHDMVYKLTTE
jgi:aldose 1-epimerase